MRAFILLFLGFAWVALVLGAAVLVATRYRAWRKRFG